MTGPRYPSVPWRAPVAMLLGLGVFAGSVWLWMRSADLVSKHDLLSYALVSTPEIPYWKPSCLLLYGSDGRLASLATSGVLTKRTVRLEQLHVSRDTLRQWLQVNVYDGASLPMVLWWPITAGAIVLFGLLIGAVYLDQCARSEIWNGRVLRGPRIVSRWRWNLRTFGKRKNAFYLETR
jgi:hypothetical protein